MFHACITFNGALFWLNKLTGYWYPIMQAGTLYKCREMAQDSMLEWGLGKPVNMDRFEKAYIGQRSVNDSRYYWNDNTLQWETDVTDATVYFSLDDLLEDLEANEVKEGTCIRMVLRINTAMKNTGVAYE